jgi:dihydroorotate dehydrogenase
LETPFSHRSGPKGVAGLIISNTTVSRPSDLKNIDVAKETGGLSGKPVRELSTEVIRKVYKATDGKLPIIGKALITFL